MILLATKSGDWWYSIAFSVKEMTFQEYDDSITIICDVAQIPLPSSYLIISNIFEAWTVSCK
jgi:hypothetical protein